jgi:hypothetical protein
MPNLEERAEQPAKKPRKAYMGRRALLDLVLSKSPSTRKWLMAKMERQAHVKEKAERDIRILAKSLGVKLAKLELKD